MSNVLWDLEVEANNMQEAARSAQFSGAESTKYAAAKLKEFFAYAKIQLDRLMEPDKSYGDGKGYNPEHGMPPSDSKANSDTYAQDVARWQTFYGQRSQELQNIENMMNTPIKALDQNLTSLGEASQRASQDAALFMQAGKSIAALLNSPL